MKDGKNNESIILFDREKLEQNFSKQVKDILGSNEVGMYFQNVKEELLNLYEHDIKSYNEAITRSNPTSDQVGICLSGKDEYTIKEVYFNDGMSEKVKDVKTMLEKATDCDFGKNKIILESYLKRETISEEQRKSGIFREYEFPLENNKEKLVEYISVKVNDRYLTKADYEKFKNKKEKEARKSIKDKLKEIKNKTVNYNNAKSGKLHNTER